MFICVNTRWHAENGIRCYHPVVVPLLLKIMHTRSENIIMSHTTFSNYLFLLFTRFITFFGTSDRVNTTKFSFSTCIFLNYYQNEISVFIRTANEWNLFIRPSCGSGNFLIYNDNYNAFFRINVVKEFSSILRRLNPKRTKKQLKPFSFYRIFSSSDFEYFHI